MSCVAHFRNAGVCTAWSHCVFPHYPPSRDRVFCMTFDAFGRVFECRNIDSGNPCDHPSHFYAGTSRAELYREWFARLARKTPLYRTIAFDTGDATALRRSLQLNHSTPVFASTMEDATIASGVRFMPNVDHLRAPHAARHTPRAWTRRPHRIRRAFWRGAPAMPWDSTIDFRQHARVVACRLSKTHPYVLDARLTEPAYELASAGLREYIRATSISAPRVPFRHFLKHRLVLSIDGMGTHGALFDLFAHGTSVIKVNSSLREWWYSFLTPGVHYLQTKSDLSDLIRLISSWLDDDAALDRIARRARTLAECVATTQDNLWSGESSQRCG